MTDTAISPTEIAAFVEGLIAEFPKDADEIMACYNANAALATVPFESLTGDERHRAKAIMSAITPGADTRIVRLEDGGLAMVVLGLKRWRLSSVIFC